MIDGWNEKDLAGAIEALLFVTDEPVSALVLAKMLECEVQEVSRTLEDIRRRFEEDNRGIQLREVAGGWRLFTHPRYHELIERYVLSWDTRKLSAAAMETLAIVAYTQPVTRGEIASIRGVSSDSSVNSLVEKGLVKEVGTADTPGNPILYGTTKAFLERFGLRSIADLTDIAEFAPDEETRRLISERLSATREETGISEEEARLMTERMLEEHDIRLEEASVALGVSGEAVGDASADVAVQVEEGEAEGMESQMDEMFKSALASTLGLVEKIDFDKLEFDFDDE